MDRTTKRFSRTLAAVAPALYLASNAPPAAASGAPGDVAVTAPASRLQPSGPDDLAITSEEAAATATAGPNDEPDPGPYFVATEAGDDAPVNLTIAGSTGSGDRQAACGAAYKPRGGSLIPPDGGWLIYWDAPGPGYEVRGMRGVECLGGRKNYYVSYGNVKRYTKYDAQYGRRVVTKSGLVYEGCKKEPAHDRFWCDFSSNRSKPSRLVPNKSSQYLWMVLRQWAHHTARTQATCSASIVGLWVNTSTLSDASAKCAQAGPYRPG